VEDHARIHPDSHSVPGALRAGPCEVMAERKDRHASTDTPHVLSGGRGEEPRSGRTLERVRPDLLIAR